MRKPGSCLCENKDTDQLCSNFTADQRLCFCYADSTILSSSSIRDFKVLAILGRCTCQFVSDLVENPEDRFSRVTAHVILMSQISWRDDFLHLFPLIIDFKS